MNDTFPPSQESPSQLTRHSPHSQIFIEFSTVAASSSAKHLIDKMPADGGHLGQKKISTQYWNPNINPFRTLPKDAPARGKDQTRGGVSGSYNERGNYSNAGGGFSRGRGGFNGGRGNMNQNNYNRNFSGGNNMGYNNNMMGGGGFNGHNGQGNFGFNNRGMMGGMRGGPNMRGRGGMMMNPMGMGMGMPMGMMGPGMFAFPPSLLRMCIRPAGCIPRMDVVKPAGALFSLFSIHVLTIYLQAFKGCLATSTAALASTRTKAAAAAAAIGETLMGQSDPDPSDPGIWTIIPCS
jgi:hypothetical protein